MATVRRLWLGLRIAGVLAIAALICGGVVDAHAAGTHSMSSARPDKVKTSPFPTQSTVGPSIEALPTAGGNAVALGNGENLAGKTQTVITLPPLVVYAYPQYADSLTDPAFPGGNGRLTALAYIVGNPTTVTGQPASYITYGQIPTLHITTLAFGAIPISADLTLAQTVTDGKVDPLVVYDAFTTDNLTLSGRLSVHLTNVSVDGQSLHLSPSCTTVTPAILTAYATSEEYQIFTGGRLAGDTTLPDFTGCTATDAAGQTENLDPLLDGTISGTDNPTYLTQNGLGTYDGYFKNDCYPSPPPKLPFHYANGCLPYPATALQLPPITASIPVPTVTTSEYDPPAY